MGSGTLSWLLRLAADSINPIFLVLILEEPLLGAESPRERMRRCLHFWMRAALCIVVAVALAESGKKYEVWAGHPGFPSGHSTFATAAGTVLVLHRGRPWLWLAAPLALLMGVSLAYHRWHTLDEVLAGWALGTVTSLLLWRLTSRKPRPTASRTQ